MYGRSKELVKFLDAVKRLNGYGDAIFTQLYEVADGQHLDDMNMNALRIIMKEMLDIIKKVRPDLSDDCDDMGAEIEEYLEDSRTPVGNRSV